MPVADLTRRIKYFVANYGTSTVSVIDGFTNAVTKTYTVGAGPKEVVGTQDGSVYVASTGNDTVTIICIDGNTRVLNVPNDGYLAVDIITGRLYVTNTSNLNVYDIASGTLIISVQGLSAPGYLRLSNGRGKIFVTDGSTVKIYNTSSFDLINTITLPSTANYVIPSADDTKLFISYGYTPTLAGVQVYDLGTLSFITNISNPVLTDPDGMALKNNVLYVTNNTAIGYVYSIDTFTYTFNPVGIQVGANPVRMALSPDNTRLYVTNNGSGTVSIVDITSSFVEAVFLGAGTQPFGIAGVYVGSLISPGEPIDFSDSYQLDDIKESVCIIAKKVFSHCQQRICYPNVLIPLPCGCGTVTFEKIVFSNGFIVPGSLVITPLPERPNFSRVQFAISVQYVAYFINSKGCTVTYEGVLPDILKDIIIFIPDTRDEFNFDIVVETRSEILNTPIMYEDDIKVAVGVFIVVKVVGEVQLLIPAFGYCPEPPECEEYEEPLEEDICKVFLDFTQTPFPEDFFPPQFQDVQCKI